MPSPTSPHHKRLAKIRDTIDPSHYALAWTLVGIEVRKSNVCQVLATGFNLIPSFAEAIAICKEICEEYETVLNALQNHGTRFSFDDENIRTFCLTNFIRDLKEINSLALITLRRVLAQCKCCEKHRSRRPLCQEKKRQPGYNIHDCSAEVSRCKCLCRLFSRTFEQALTSECPLEVNGQAWRVTTA